MTQEEIEKAFNGRWRMKNYILENIDGKAAKEIARDFFEAGILLGENNLPWMDAANSAMELQVKFLEEHGAGVSVDPKKTFDAWWNLYDKKCGKENCLKKWLKMSTGERYACFASTPAYVASTPDKQFRKNPLTYLNQKAWNDEIILKNNGEPTKQSAEDKLASILVG